MYLFICIYLYICLYISQVKTYVYMLYMYDNFNTNVFHGVFPCLSPFSIRISLLLKNTHKIVSEFLYGFTNTTNISKSPKKSLYLLLPHCMGTKRHMVKSKVTSYRKVYSEKDLPPIPPDPYFIHLELIQASMCFFLFL